VGKIIELYVRALMEVRYAMEPKKGQGVVEYVCILALVSIVIIAVVSAIGANVLSKFADVKEALVGAATLIDAAMGTNA